MKSNKESNRLGSAMRIGQGTWQSTELKFGTDSHFSSLERWIEVYVL